MEIALESGHVIKPKNGWYNKPGEEKNYRFADTNTAVFWDSILNDNGFKEFVRNKYMLSHKNQGIGKITNEEVSSE